MPSALPQSTRCDTHELSKMKVDECFSFGPFKLVPQQALLLENGIPVRLGSRVMEILTLLVDRSPETVPHREILDHVWPDTSVDDISLRVNLTALRKALREHERDVRYIVNTPGYGYRFAAPVVRTQGFENKNILHSNVPKSLMQLVGRDSAVETIAHELQRRRFVTITGPGGIGKTSVALAVTNQLFSRYRDGALLVDLASVSDVHLVADTLASALQIPELIGTDLPQVLRHLHERQVIVILDNCDHVVEAAAHLAESLLKNSGMIAVIATCREPLRAEGERVFRLGGLETPPGSSPVRSAEALEFSAIRLFMDRADAGAVPFMLTDADAPALAQLCRSLDGIPLAIELAAARVGLFGITGLIARLADNFSLLTGGRRTAQPRHKSLQANLDWSYNLLSTSERTLLTRLSIFRTCFTEEAAAAIAACEKISASDVLLGLTELTRKSLAIAKLHGSTVVYRLLETTRVYYACKLSEHPERADLYKRLAHFTPQQDAIHASMIDASP